MNSAEPSGDKLGLGLVWRVIPALWVLVGMGGFSTLTYRPEWFAEAPRADRIAASAECSMVFTATSLDSGVETPPDARAISTSMEPFQSTGETRTGDCKPAGAH